MQHHAWFDFRDLERAEAFPDDCFLLPAASFLMLAG